MKNLYNYSAETKYSDKIPKSMLENESSEIKIFCKKNVILHIESESKTTGIILDGTAFLISINRNGEESILDYYEKGDIFGNRFCPQNIVNLYDVIARNDCEVLLFQNDLYHNSTDINNFLNDVTIKNIQRTHMHIDILSQRSIREKIIKYLQYNVLLQKKNNIILPMSLSELAGYLAIDRSAMMRELKKLNNENIIISKGQKITLL